ncbi:MAG: hypothetical protein QG649_345 [Patescibacteria group bacterium]|jgi:hypothetical protein|nr:hypothetical protein [Patescibacteria group bacterium]
MASPKNKTTTTKAPTKRKAAPRKAAVKKTTRKSVPLTSQIGLRKEETDFMTFRITRQTLYWIVLGAVVILFTMWLMKLQADVQSLYDQIDANTVELSTGK